ncbi:MAG: VOC family protein [Anaerolineales bacterium]|nr:VOC family protein [Anaerolineales bacterium]
MSKRDVVHIEIPAASPQAAGTFYEKLFGWKMQHVPEFDYTMWADDGGGGGGFNKVSDENPVGQVLVYIASDDIDADLKNVEKLGGTVVRAKTEIPGTGWFGLFKDPTGNTLAIYTSANPDFNK